MSIIESHVVPDDAGKVRLKEYAIEVICSISSRKGVLKAIKRGEIRLNGSKSEPGRFLSPGMRIDLVKRELTENRSFRLLLRVLYEDNNLAVIDKPPGFPVNGNRFKTVENALSYNLRPSFSNDALSLPRPVHRLDNSTGGVLVIAKTHTAQVNLGRQFQERNIRKSYSAVVIGKLTGTGIISRSIQGKEAVTRYEAERHVPSLRNGFITELMLHPVTGRHHQLRRHLSDLGFPILGDRLYGREGEILRSKGLFLWAERIRFSHPVNGRIVDINSSNPDKFRTFMDREERRWYRYNSQVLNITENGEISLTDIKFNNRDSSY